MSKCYQCAHADFKTPHGEQMSGFCHCKIERQPWHYKPSCHECDKQRFQTAGDETMAARKRFFQGLGKDVSAMDF